MQEKCNLPYINIFPSKKYIYIYIYTIMKWNLLKNNTLLKKKKKKKTFKVKTQQNLIVSNIFVSTADMNY